MKELFKVFPELFPQEYDSMSNWWSNSWQNLIKIIKSHLQRNVSRIWLDKYWMKFGRHFFANKKKKKSIIGTQKKQLYSSYWENPGGETLVESWDK